MSKSELNRSKLEALKARYEAQRLEAISTIMVYLDNAAGIGEHPQIIDEMDKQICKLSDAQDRSKLVDRLMQEFVGPDKV